MNNAQVLFPWDILVKRIFLFLLFSILIIGTAKATGTIDSTKLYLTTEFIGTLKGGTSPDTVIGKAGVDRRFIPDRIIWGPDNLGHGIPPELRKPYTTFIYPDWKNFHASVNFDKINSDTLYDLVFIMWGRLQLDPINYKDTAAAFVIFGKIGFDTLATINLNNVDSFQINPFIAIKLNKGTGLTECNSRDYTGTKSYKLNKMDITPPPPIINDVLEDKDGILRIYPNPAVYYTNIELNQMKPGNYKIVLTELNGSTVNEQELTLNTTDCIKHVIDLQNVPSGAYYLRIYTDSKFIGNYSIIVIH